MTKRFVFTTLGILSTFAFTAVLETAVAQASPTVSKRGASIAAGDPQTFGFNGALQTVVVPAGITGAALQISGASGGSNTSHGGTAAGGVGAKIIATIPVNAGDTFTLGVGGQGDANDGNKAPGGGGWASAPQYTGGGGGRARGSTTTDGSGGGGATTVVLDGQLIAVAAGGGGGGGFGSLGGTYTGGAGGDSQGSNGAKYLNNTGGQGGGASNPALDKTGGSETGINLSGGGGGGGGGQYVGQGGSKSVDGGGGGGGGSSLHTFTATSVMSAAFGNGSVVITWQEPAATITGTPPSQYLGRTYDYGFAVTGSAIVTLTAGNLPPGLTLSTGGAITGVPTQVGTYAFTLTATNAIGHADLATGITILATVAPTVQGTPPPGQVDTAYGYQFQVTGIPYATTTVTDPTDLPPGLSLDGQTATLSGTPTTPGTYRFTLIATNGVNPDARLPVSLVINGSFGQGPTHAHCAHIFRWCLRWGRH